MREELQTPEISGEPEAARIPELRDRRPKPEGVVPKQSQGYVIAGLAVLILLAVMFSNSRAKSVAKPSPAILVVYSTDANQRDIEQLKRDLTEEQRKSELRAQPESGRAAVKEGAENVPATTGSGGEQSSVFGSVKRKLPNQAGRRYISRSLSATT
jgi:type IV secretion system protein VirB10